MTKEQLKALIDYINAKAGEVTGKLVGLADQWDSWDEEKRLYEVFGLDFFEED